MWIDKKSRRGFLKTAGAGVACALAWPDAGFSMSDSASAAELSVTAFGARGDGQALDTAAINKAIEAAALAGGAAVFFPAGKYLCHSIHLKSNITLSLSPGAAIVAADSSPGTSYDPAESNQPWEAYQDFGHNHWHNSLIWGEGLENVAITGPGLIWGKGLSRGWGAGPKAEDPGVGNKTIALKNCRNVLLRDFSILHGGHFGILATGVDDITIDNLKIDTNRDGMDVDCCRNVHISKCSVNSPWDDGICLKSSYALGYARATELVTITGCMVSGGFEEGSLLDGTFKPLDAGSKAWRTGRIKFGTESNGGFKNITVSDCVFESCHGLALESEDGALLEDIAISNLTMRDIVAGPIFLRLGARMRGPRGVPVGALRRVAISNVVCSNAAGSMCSIISGVPGHAIEDLRLSDILIEHQGGGSRPASVALPENERDYPDPDMFGPTPAQGFFIRHVNGIEMSGIRVLARQPDSRPAFVLSDVQHADLSHISAPAAPRGAVYALEDVKDFRLSASPPAPDTQLEKAEKREI